MSRNCRYRSNGDVATLEDRWRGLRADYDGAKTTRYLPNLTGVLASGSGADFHYRNQAEFLRMIERALDGAALLGTGKGLPKQSPDRPWRRRADRDYLVCQVNRRKARRGAGARRPAQHMWDPAGLTGSRPPLKPLPDFTPGSSRCHLGSPRADVR